MTIYECDCCGRSCSRPHRLIAYGLDTLACDECAHYDWEAYDEDEDPVLQEGIGPSLYTREEGRRMRAERR